RPRAPAPRRARPARRPAARRRRPLLHPRAPPRRRPLVQRREGPLGRQRLPAAPRLPAVPRPARARGDQPVGPRGRRRPEPVLGRGPRARRAAHWQTDAAIIGGFRYRNLAHSMANLYRRHKFGVASDDQLRRYFETYAVRWVIISSAATWW